MYLNEEGHDQTQHTPRSGPLGHSALLDRGINSASGHDHRHQADSEGGR